MTLGSEKIEVAVHTNDGEAKAVPTSDMTNTKAALDARVQKGVAAFMARYEQWKCENPEAVLKIQMACRQHLDA